MKKFLSVLLAATAMSVQAQTLMVNDFESGDGGAYVAWGGTCEVIDNPVVDEKNPSAKVFKVISESYAPVGFPVSLPEGKSLLDYTGVRFQLAILEEVEGSAIQWVGVDVGVAEDKGSMELVNVENAGAAWGDAELLKWMDIELLFSEEKLAQLLSTFETEECNILIKVGREGFIYAIDNVRLVEKEVLGNPNILFTFETMDLGGSPRFDMPFSGSCEVVENTYKSTLNDSEKALKIENQSYSPVTLANALPEGKKWSDYEALKFQVCMVSGAEIEWAGIEIGVRSDNGQHTKIGAAYDEDGNETAAYGDCSIGEWMNIQLTINPSLITEEAAITSMLYIRLMKENMEYLLDNIEVVPVGQGTAIEKVGFTSMNVYGGKDQIRLQLSEKTNIVIYSIDGRIISSEVLSEGEHTFNLTSGIYIVNNKKVVVY